MSAIDKSKEQLIKELEELREKFKQCMASETECRRILEQLKDSEGRYRMVFESANDVLLLIDKNGKILDVNEKLSELTDYKREDIIGKNIRMLTNVISAKSLALVMKNFMKRMAGMNVPSYEVEIMRKDKTVVLAEINAVAVKQDGKIVGDLAVVRDINERKNAEKALRESEVRFRAIFETAEDSIFIKDYNLQYTQVNPAMEKLFGMPASKLIGKTDEELFGKKAGAHIKQVDSRVLAGEVVEEENTKPVMGKPLTFQVIKVPLRDSSGKIIGLCGIARDISDRKRAEEQLRESEERYRSTVELAPDGIVMIDKKGVITSCNAIFFNLTGYSKNEIVGKHFSKMPTLHVKDIPKYIRMFRALLRKKPIEPFEAVWRHKDGFQRWAEVHSSVIKRGAKTVGFQAIVRDITERKKAEKLLRESEEKYRAAVERSADNIYLLDIESKKILETNAALQKLLGYSPEELAKLTIYDIVAHPRDDINGKIKKIFKVKRSFIGERKYRRRDGAIVDVEVSASYITITGRKALIVVSRDITDRKRVEQALRESEEKYKTLTENINVGIYRNTVGPKGKFIEANPAIVKMFGYDTKYDFLAINVVDLYQHPRDRARFNKKMLEQGFVHNEELQLMKNDGTPFIGSVSAVAVKDEHGKVKYYDGIIEDITDRKEAEGALLESEQKFRGLYESVRDGIIMVDMEGHILECNQSFLDMLGYTQKEIVALTYQGVTPIRYHKFEESIVKKQILARGFSDEYEKKFIKKDGTKRAVTVTRWVVRNERGVPIGMWSIVRDITERKRHEAELEHMATHDILTGLPNRMLFKDRLEQALKYAQRKGLQLAVMLLDLDQFKEINDSLGHSVGDKLLQHVGERLSSVLRKGDTVARMGGDEFMLLLPEITHVRDSSTIAQKILTAIRTPLKVEQHRLHITTSIGIAVYPLDGLNADILMKNADIAMYWAKDKGRNDYQRYNQAIDTKKNTH